MSAAWTVETLLQSVDRTTPPAGLPALVEALWWDAHGDWNHAHRIAQDIHTRDAAWVHAYLHRKEGDHGNAGYWYRHAGRPVSTIELTDEWRDIAAALLAS